MMRRTIVLFCICILALSNCMMNRLEPGKKSILLRQDSSGLPIRIDVEPGDAYHSLMKAGPFTFNVLPQVVVWTEDEEGRLLETLYVSGADYKKMKHAGKEKLGEKFYRDNFPVWSSKSEKAGKILPSKKNPYPDSVTSATPMDGFQLETRVENVHRISRICLEINKSGDTNQGFPAKEGDWDGQPALLYSVKTDGLKDAKPLEFTLVGRSGKEGKVLGDYQGMDSALRMVKSVSLTTTDQ